MTRRDLDWPRDRELMYDLLLNLNLIRDTGKCWRFQDEVRWPYSGPDEVRFTLPGPAPYDHLFRFEDLTAFGEFLEYVDREVQRAKRFQLNHQPQEA